MTSNLDLIRGRQVVQSLTNQSGGAVIAGDVVIVSTANDESFTTTTSSAYNSTRVGVALDSIAAAAAGRILLEGYAPLVNVSASATRGHYLLTHTVAKQATSQAGYAAGAFGQIIKAGTMPSAVIFPVAQVGSAGITRSGATTDNHLMVWNGSNADSAKDGGVVPSGSADGWTAGTGTWSYSSADAPTFVISVNADMTAIIGVGQRIKLTQTTVKYFIVTAVGTFSGGNTLITVYGGTDYTLANAAITSPYYSAIKAPFGFPMTPAKWSVIVTDTTIRNQASPVKNTWYNIGTTACQIVAPIGVWYGAYKVGVYGYRTATAAQSISVTLSTANNSESDGTWTTGGYADITSGQLGLFHSMYASGIIDVATKTTLYLNGCWDKGTVLNQDGTQLYFRNDQMTMVLSLRCAYL